MKKEEFYFDSRDGMNQIHAVRYVPDTDKVCCVVQIVHGMSEYVERYEELAQFLTDKGIVVTGEDHLGHGKTVPNGGVYGYFCEQDPATVVVRDVHRLKKMTQAIYPNVPYVILGHSMGSFILRNYMCRYGTGISGAVIVGTGMPSPFLVGIAKAVLAVQKLFGGSKAKGVLVNRLAFGTYNKRCIPHRTSSDWLSRDEENVNRYIADPFCNFVFTVNGFQTLFELIARIQKKENLEKIPKNLPVYMLSGAEDPVGEYGEGVTRAYHSLQEAGLEKIQMKLYEKDRHEILNETDRNCVQQDIYDWLRNTILV